LPPLTSAIQNHGGLLLWSLKAEYSNYNIIEVLPVENVSQIGFKAPTFYSKDVREIGALMANTEVFIDSGIMHLASASKVSTGLFPAII
jgi:muconolactone delta-isomerase